MDWAAAWQATWSAMGVAPPAPGLLESLLAHYDEPHRHYHTRQHLRECLAHGAALRAQARHPAEIELALWFHDAIYDVHRHDNEAHSAAWASREMRQAGLPAAAVRRVAGMILATRHDARPEPGDPALLVDIDLAILGAPPARFAEYERQVRAEYHWVPAPLFRRKRRQILRAFLARPAIYTTPAFHARYEAQARHNLQQALQRLLA